MITALPKAQELWNDPKELIQMWETIEDKSRHERLISGIIGQTGNVVDLGCGIGRYADLLKYKTYMGYDSSSEMILEANIRRPEELGVEFSCVDIFNFQSDKSYDVAIMIDVAHHQNNPLYAIATILDLWEANKYFFTLLVGDKEELLYNSYVVPFSKFADFVGKFKVKIEYIEKGENHFSWVLFSI